MQIPRLYGYQYVFMVMLFCLSNIFLPGIVESGAGTGAFSGFLFAIPIGLLLIFLYCRLFSRKNAGLCSVAERAFGKGLGKAVCAVYALYFLFVTAELLSFYGMYAVDNITENIKPVFFVAPAVLVAAFTAAKSTAVVGRTSVVVGAVMLTAAAVFSVASIFSGNVKNLSPLVSAPLPTLVKVTLSLTSLEFGQLIAVVSLSSAQEGKKLAKKTLLSSLVGNGIVILTALALVLIKGQSATINDVAYAAGGSGELNLGGLKVLAAAVFFFSAIFRVSVCLRAATCCIKDVFGVRDERPLALPAGTVLLGLSLVFCENISASVEFMLKYAWVIGLLPQLIIPAATAAALKVREAKGKPLCSE